MKGLGYALEVIVATLTVFIFVFGAFQVSGPQQDWSEYQREVAAQDITYSMESVGLNENFLKRGETGSLQTVASTVSDRGMGVSGLVSELPKTETSVGFYALSEDRELQNVGTTGSECSDADLSVLQDQSSSDILRTEGDLDSIHQTTLYFGNRSASGSGSLSGYDTLWVDNGTQCQFGPDSGPYSLDDIFLWGDRTNPAPVDNYEFRSIQTNAGNTDGEASFYNATQPIEIAEEMNKGPNNISADVNVELVNFNELESENFDVTVFRKLESIQDINSQGKNELMNDLIREGSILMLMDLESRQNITDNEFLSDTGIDWIDTGYKEDYAGGSTQASFSVDSNSVDLQTYYRGMEEDNFNLTPPGKAVTNDSENLRPSNYVYSEQERYNVTEWMRTDFNMVSRSPGSDAPDSECYTGGPYSQNGYNEIPLTEGSVTFPGGENIDFISAKLGQTETACEDLAERGVKFDLDGVGGYESDLYLNGESINIDGREFIIQASVPPSDYSDCSEWGECIRFIPAIDGSDDFVELMVVRDNFQNLTGNRFAMTGYNASYTENQKTFIGSTIFWLSGEETAFTGSEQNYDVTSSAIGSIEGQTYLPYRIFLRWSN